MRRTLRLARVLLVDDDPASRLTLQTILRAGGYSVDCAASAAEAIDKLEAKEYELVLTDMGMESPEAGYRVLDHARTVDYRPAAALLTTYRTGAVGDTVDRDLLIETEDIPGLLQRVAELIGSRADRRLRRELRRELRIGALQPVGQPVG